MLQVLRGWNVLVYSILVLGVGVLGFSACIDEDKILTEGNVSLEFSVDTLRFDTVFTEVGTATRLVKIYNPYDKSVIVSRIALAGTAGNTFRLNIDGQAGNEALNVKIRPRDSLYVFAEATINPDAPLAQSPFVIEDQILVETNGKRQAVVLEAWGQNANYFPSRDNQGNAVVLTCNNQILEWNDPKPYVVYGAVFIDSCHLVIPAGTRVHIHGGVAVNDLFGGIYNDGMIYVLEKGRLSIRGTQEKPVVIQGDRLEEEFEDGVAQWNGIILGRGSKGNLIEHATIKNARFGVLVDSLASLETRSSQFYNMASSGLVSYAGNIVAENCLMHSTGGNGVQLLLGGTHDFTYCTMASYGSNSSALGMGNFFCYTNDCAPPEGISVRPLRAKFTNCLIYGSQTDELELSDATERKDPARFNVSFTNCVVRVRSLLTDNNKLYGDFFETYCKNCINGTITDKVFRNASDADYHLDTLSVAEGKAVPLFFPAITKDLDGVNRDPKAPDVGCYEFVPRK